MYIVLAFIVFMPVLIFLGLAVEEYLEVKQLVSKGIRTMAEVTNVAKFEVIVSERVPKDWFEGTTYDALTYGTSDDLNYDAYEYFLQYYDHNNQLKKISATNLLTTTIGHKIPVIYYKHYVRIDSFRFLYGKLTLLILGAIGAIVLGGYVLPYLSAAII